MVWSPNCATTARLRRSPRRPIEDVSPLHAWVSMTPSKFRQVRCAHRRRTHTPLPRAGLHAQADRVEHVTGGRGSDSRGPLESSAARRANDDDRDRITAWAIVKSACPCHPARYRGSRGIRLQVEDALLAIEQEMPVRLFRLLLLFRGMVQSGCDEKTPRTRGVSNVYPCCRLSRNRCAQ